EDGTLLDYSYGVCMTNLQFPVKAVGAAGEYSDASLPSPSPSQHQQWIDDLLLDCEISDSGLMPRTFWVPCEGFAPRCALEQLALDIFNHHVPDGSKYDKSTSGAEWWCQLRPSPCKTGRYSMHCNDENGKEKDGGNSNSTSEPDPFAHGISFHVDKDEDLRILTGGNTYIHPHISTVTYLTDWGSPTMMMDTRVHPLEGTWMVPDPKMEGFVSWPSCGKHASFDGRYLHASPCDLMEEGYFAKQIHFEPKGNDPKYNKLETRRHRRVTFLVNVWLNHHPFEVKPFPETMLDKMSGSNQRGEDSKRKALEFLPTLLGAKPDDATHVQRVHVTRTAATELVTKDASSINYSTSSYTPQRFTWPLGDRTSTEKLQLQVPLRSIRKEAERGGNVRVTWENVTEDSEDRCFQILGDNTVEEMT
ncbi:MAG: hypothetical protein SGILL_004427, partial [Bacillariaceae sp.]